MIDGDSLWWWWWLMMTDYDWGWLRATEGDWWQWLIVRMDNDNSDKDNGKKRDDIKMMDSPINKAIIPMSQKMLTSLLI